ncbi:hypothetical protein ACVXHB_28460 [Escherichia coli]
MSDQIIARVSQSLAKEQSLESLVRQLLEMLEMVTDMESTYLTKVDVEARLQHIMLPVTARKCTCRNFTIVRGITRYANAPLMKTAFSAMKSRPLG